MSEPINIDQYIAHIKRCLEHLNAAVMMTTWTPYYSFPIPSCLATHPEKIEFIENQFPGWRTSIVKATFGANIQTMIIFENGATNFPLAYST